MLSFLSSAVSTVLGGNDDGLFDLATAETFIQGLEDNHCGVDTFGPASDTKPQPEAQITTSFRPDSPGPLPATSCPLPEEEQAILDLGLPVVAEVSEFASQDITDPVHILTDVCNDQDNIVLPDIPVAPPEYYASFMDDQGSLSHIFGHMAAVSPRNPEIDDAEALNSIPPMTGKPASARADAVVAVFDKSDDSMAPKQTTSLISPFTSLKDTVLKPERDDEAAVLLFDDTQSVDTFHDATSVPSGLAALSGMAAGHDPAPVSEVTTGKTVQQEHPAETVSSPLSKSKPSSKKKGVGKGPRCKKCREHGHLVRDCPTKQKHKKQEALSVEQQVPPREQTQEPALPVPAVVSPEFPSKTARSIPNWLSGVLGTSTLTTEDEGGNLRPAALSLSGPSELRGECSTGFHQPGHFNLFGPSSLTYHDDQQDGSGLLGPSCLTKSYLKDAAGEDEPSHAESTSEEPQDADGDVEHCSRNGSRNNSPKELRNDSRNEMRNLLEPSTLTEQQQAPLRFGILGPQTLTKDSSGPGQLDAEHNESKINWDSDETLVCSSPRRGILEVVSSHVPWFGSRRRAVKRYARDELLGLRPSVEVTPPTAQCRIGEGYPLVARPRDRSLRVEVATLKVEEKVEERKTALASNVVVSAAQAVHKSQPLQNKPQKKQARMVYQKQSTSKQTQQQQRKLEEPMSIELSKTSNGPKQTRRQMVNLTPPQPPPPPLPFKTITAPHIEAWSYASMVYSSPAGSLINEFGPHNLVMWTDATAPDPCNKRLQALSVTYRQPHSPLPSVSETDERQCWRDWAFTADVDRASVNNVIAVLETMAIKVAVGIALGEVDKAREARSPPIRKVTVFTDSQDALAGLRLRKPGQDRPIEGYAERLGEKGVEVELRWVPGHASVAGNERADRLALLASKYAPAPERKGGMVRVPVSLLRVCESQVARMEAWSRPADQAILRPFLDVQRRELKEALRSTGVEEGWLADS